MKSIKKWLLLLGFLIVIVGLCSCQKVEPISIDTSLNIDSNFNGERVMTGTVPGTVLNRLFGGDIEQLKTVIEKYCPVEMGCTVEASGSNAKVTLVIPFASLSEYKTKVYRILIDDSNPNRDIVDTSVYYDVSDTMFKKGYAIEEAFSSKDMFYWITTAVKTEFPRFEDDDFSELYTSGKTMLVYNGTQIETESCIHYSQMTSNAFKNVQIYVSLDDKNNVYNGRVELTVERAAYDNAQMLELNEAMDKLSSNKIQLKTSLTNTDKIYTFSFEATSTRLFENYMNRIFASQESKLEIAEEDSGSETLRARKYITLYVDSGQYMDFSTADSEVTCIIETIGNYSMESCEGVSHYVRSSSFECVNNISTAYISMSADDEVTLVLGTDVALDSVEVSTKIYHEYNVERQIAFYLSPSRDALIGGSLEERIKERRSNFIEYERTDLGDIVRYLVTIRTDSAKKLADLTCAFLDGSSASGKSELNGGSSESHHLRHMQMSYSDRIDFSSFLGGSTVDKGINYVFEYPRGYIGSFSGDNAYENIVQEDNKLSCTTFNKSIVVSSSAEKTNWNGIIQIFLWYVTLAIILVLLLLSLPTIVGCIKARKIDCTDIGLFTHKGYIFVTIFTVTAVIFVITTIRLIFRVY